MSYTHAAGLPVNDDASATIGAVRGSPPNVVIILADDLGYAGLEDRGPAYLETPNIEAIGAAGMRFTNGLSAYPICKPTRGALLTGQYGARTGIHRVVDRHVGLENRIRYRVPENRDLAPSAVTLAEVFQEHGYTTAMYGKWAVSNNRAGHPVNHGFDRAIVSQSSHLDFQTWPDVPVGDGDTSAGEFMTEQAIGFMTDAVRDDVPFFLYMPYFLIHKPFQSNAADVAYFEKKVTDSADETLPAIAAMTRDLDRLVGKLDDALGDLGVRDDTIVVFTSDNGAYNEQFVGELRGRKGQVYEGGMRVPYFFRFPGRIEPGIVSDDRIITLDLFPTLLDLAGLERPKKVTLDGTSLAPLLLGQIERLAERPLICFFPYYARFSESTGRWYHSWRNVLYRGDYKFIEYPEYGEAELFDLSADPGEANNLADAEPDRLDAMRGELAMRLDDMNVSGPEPNPGYLGGNDPN